MNPSKDLIPYPVFEGEAIHSSSDFKVYIGPWPNPMWEGQQGYHLVNQRTNVIEGVLGTEAMALQEMETQQSFIDAVQSGEGPKSTADDAEFQAMLERLDISKPNN